MTTFDSDDTSDPPDAELTDIVAGAAPGGTIEVVDRDCSLYRINGTLMRIPDPMIQTTAFNR